MARTLSEDEYNDLIAKVDNLEHVLRDIAAWFVDGSPYDKYEALDSIEELIDELKTQGYLQ